MLLFIKSSNQLNTKSASLNDSSSAVAAAAASVLPTPLAYSRSSSVTSLNSCLADDDLKSVHSSVASEYSHHPKATTTATAGNNNGKKQHNQLDESQQTIGDSSLLTDFALPESPAACEGDSSFLVAQRRIHKEQQALCRQQAALSMNNTGNLQAELAAPPSVKPPPPPLSTAAAAAAGYHITNTPPIKLVSNNPPMPPPVATIFPKFLVNQAAMQVRKIVIRFCSSFSWSIAGNCFHAMRSHVRAFITLV